MLYLIWSVFNILFFLTWAYLAICFLTGKHSIFKKSFSIGYIILIIGIISLISGKSKESTNSSTPSNKPVNIEIIKIEESTLNNLYLTLIRDKETDSILHDLSSSTLTGFISGLKWTHMGISENNGNLTLLGTISWKLLGWTIYTQNKEVMIKESTV
ncbi:hypothetical protein [Algoriphagus machipongonensis]|uniref:Uncharacterized protein n=1 Tax=Algoriphagus machipongonensis TaxID=388413 RepID=A3I0R5_9BACT|nr:hypothetical protein [Algoriphagus machipongonensis]EAZ80061.1 hypothetical protein ALPR1_15569 [Algoriphagus machipongonensis]